MSVAELNYFSKLWIIVVQEFKLGGHPGTRFDWAADDEDWRPVAYPVYQLILSRVCPSG